MAYGKDDPEYNKKTSIAGRDQDFKGKSVPEQVKELEGKSFAEEIEQDKNRSAVLIGRAEEASNHPTDPNTKQEVESVAIYKRALILLGSSNLQVNSESGETKAASENNLPLSSYLSHGSRTVIQLPKLKEGENSNHDLINWLTSGDKNKDGKSTLQDPNKAMEDGKYVYNRAAATHDVSVDENGKVKEEKGFTIGLKSFLGNKILGQETRHFGVDLAVDAAYGGKDASGNIVLKPDGDHGHLYIHYTPATKDTPGSIMFGMEGAAPYSSKHSKTGASDPISPTGVSKFDDLAIKKQCAQEKEYEGTIVPKKYNGLYANLDSNKINELTTLSDKNFSIELAEAKPGKSPEDFVKGIKEEKFHESPKLVPSKPPESIQQEKPTLLQNIANKVTFGVAYKKEVDKYKIESKIFKVQSKVASKDGGRGFKTHEIPPQHKPAPDKSKGFFAKQFEKVTNYVKDTVQVVKDKIQKVIKTIKEAPAKFIEETKKEIISLMPDFIKKDKAPSIKTQPIAQPILKPLTVNAKETLTAQKEAPPPIPQKPKINIESMREALTHPKPPPIPPKPKGLSEFVKKQQQKPQFKRPGSGSHSI